MSVPHHSTLDNSALAFVFPGQGSQFVGMLKESGEAYPLIRETFEEASEAISQDLWHLSQSGPQSELNQTENTQPALLTAGVALWRVWQAQGGVTPAYLAGHSLGEYTALVCAQALSLGQAVKLVKKRGELMQAAVLPGQGAMAAILGLEDELVLAACQAAAEDQIVSPANLNAPGQVVIAGDTAAVDRAIALAKGKGAKRAIMLPVSVPSHCLLMHPAALELAVYLAQVTLAKPVIPLVHNVDLSLALDAHEIAKRLIGQLESPVRWTETIRYLAQQGIKALVECGPGKVLTGLNKRIQPELTYFNIEMPSDLEMALEKLKN